MQTTSGFVRYGPGVEQPEPDEQEYIDRILAAQTSISRRMGDRYRHGVRSVHAKNHGIATGTLHVRPNVDPPYAQGLFANAGSYDVLVRFSTNPGDVLPDDVSTPRGFALKVLGPQGERMVDGHEGERTQDFLFIDGPILGAPGPKEFAQQMQMFEKHLDDPVLLKQTISAGARLTHAVLAATGNPSASVLSLGGHPQTNLLGERFFTQLPTRHGDYVAKYCLTPANDALRALEGRKLDTSDPEAIRRAVEEFFRSERGEWDFGVQLCTDLASMPVEDGKTEWKETESPFVTVATLVLEPQPVATPERQVYADQILSFNPWHALEAHRPLGAHNRARKAAYPASSAYRHEQDVRAESEPKSADDFFKVS